MSKILCRILEEKYGLAADHRLQPEIPEKFITYFPGQE
jgi:hypothetical protein